MSYARIKPGIIQTGQDRQSKSSGGLDRNMFGYSTHEERMQPVCNKASLGYEGGSSVASNSYDMVLLYGKCLSEGLVSPHGICMGATSGAGWAGDP